MVRFLTSYLDVISEFQKNAIKSLISIKKEKGAVTSVRGQQEEILRIYNSVKSNLGKMLLDPRPAVAGQKISSVDHNYNMEAIFLDINTLYEVLNKLGKSFELQNISLDSSYEKARAGIQKLINDVKVVSLRKKYPEYSEINVLDFNYSANKTNFLPKAVINPKTRLLQLRAVFDRKVELLNRNEKITKIYTKTISPGIKTSFSRTLPVDAIVDKKPETFWTAFVMSDQPITQKYIIPSSASQASAIEIFGPIVEVYFKFSVSERINYIRLLPFGDYPVKILSISYRQNTQNTFYTPIDDFYSSSTLDWEEYNFSSVYASEVKLVIAQENSSTVTYQIPETIYKNTDVFQKIYTAKLEELVGNSIPDSDLVIESARLGSVYDDAISNLRDGFDTKLSDYVSKSKIDYYYSFNEIVSNFLSKYFPDIDQETLLAGYSQEEVESSNLIQVRKNEYVLGLREVEIGYAIYSPVGNYASDKLLPQATVSSIALEVDERHASFVTDWETNYRRTSTEWTLDLGEGRYIPIHPINQVGALDYPLAKDELLQFNISDGIATTRLGGKFNNLAALKKNGQIIPESEYIVSKVTGATPYLRVELTGSSWLDGRSTYTADYYVDNASCNIQILGKYSSRRDVRPETFTGTGPNNTIELSKFPYVDYTIVNLPEYFYYDGGGTWSYRPPIPNLFTGQVRVYPDIYDDNGTVIQTGKTPFVSVSGIWGSRSGQGAPILSGNVGLPTGYFANISGIQFGYYLQIMDNQDLVEIEVFNNTFSGNTKVPISVSLAKVSEWRSRHPATFSGTWYRNGTIDGALILDYAIGVGIKTEDNYYALNNNSYSPIKIEIEGKELINITNYETLEHPAFSVSRNQGIDYEYIQAGKRIYFNEAIGQEIKVSYNWLTDYISLYGTLRSNIPFNPDLTPKVNEARLLINTTVI